MDETPNQQFLESIRRLSELSNFTLPQIAETLGRRVEIVSETPAHIEYRLVGGPGCPFEAATFYYGPALERSVLKLDPGPGVMLTGKEAFDYFGRDGFGLVAPDPEEELQLHTLVRRVPVGELRFLVATASGIVHHVRILNHVDLMRSEQTASPKGNG